MHDFKIGLDEEAKEDIQEAIKWYNKQTSGLGKVFHRQVKKHIESLKIDPFYQTRYENVRCLPVHKFPYMIHFTVDEATKIVTIRAITHTSLKPKRCK